MDGTKGWKTVTDSTSSMNELLLLQQEEQKRLQEIIKFILLQVQMQILLCTNAGNVAGSNTVSYMVVAGGVVLEDITVQVENLWF